MERSNTHPYENTPFNDDPDSAEEEEVDVITCSTCHAERDNGVGEEEDQDDAEADGWKCDSFEWYCPECVAEEEEPNTCENPICTRRATRQFNDYYEQVVVCDACGADLDEKYSAAVAASDTLSVIEWEV